MELVGENREKGTKKFDEKNRKKCLTKPAFLYIISHVAEVSNTKARREHSSAGRASALQAGGHRFEPCCSHHNLARWCSRLARQPVTLEVDGSSPFRVAI